MQTPTVESVPIRISLIMAVVVPAAAFSSYVIWPLVFEAWTSGHQVAAVAHGVVALVLNGLVPFWLPGLIRRRDEKRHFAQLELAVEQYRARVVLLESRGIYSLQTPFPKIVDSTAFDPIPAAWFWIKARIIAATRKVKRRGT